MKLLLAQPAILRFRWELDVLLANIRQFTDMEVVLLFTKHEFIVPQHFKQMPGCDVFEYEDRRDDGSYIPSVRPWLIWQYLAEDPRRQDETYFYIDSDVIFREWIDFATLDIRPETVIGSNCSGYIDLNYLLSCQNGMIIALQMAEICGISYSQMQNVPGIGAHIILDRPKFPFWQQAYHDSNLLWHYLQGVDSNIQKWTAEMWAQLWGWVREGRQVIASPELDFCMATDPISRYDEVKILHNAGVTAEQSHELFFKGRYVTYTPFGQDLSWVRTDRCSRKYIEAIQKADKIQHKG